jgi:hypothetical protein
MDLTQSAFEENHPARRQVPPCGGDPIARTASRLPGGGLRASFLHGPVVISIRRVSLGGGFRYLMDSVAAVDGNPERSGGLSRYYADSGTPPGVFLGGGLADLDDGRGVRPGTQVSEEHLERMLVEVTDPVTGQPVGSTPRAPAGDCRWSAST